MLKLISAFCRWCNAGFCVCRSCWRGQAYCCDFCRIAGYLKSRRKAQHLYRQTSKGKKSHRLAENRRRHRKKPRSTKKMDDATSNSPFFRVMVAPREKNTVFLQPDLPGRCHFCGRSGQIVPHFPRRRYGNRVYE